MSAGDSTPSPLIERLNALRWHLSADLEPRHFIDTVSEAIAALAQRGEAQGEAVAWANWRKGTDSYVPFRTREEAAQSVARSEVSATQEGPYLVVALYAAPPSRQGVPREDAFWSQALLNRLQCQYERDDGHNGEFMLSRADMKLVIAALAAGEQDATACVFRTGCQSRDACVTAGLCVTGAEMLRRMTQGEQAAPADGKGG